MTEEIQHSKEVSELTPEMIAAGVAALRLACLSADPLSEAEHVATAVFAAMRQAQEDHRGG